MEQNKKMPFGKKNYKIMLIGLVILITGFVIMGSDSEPFGFGFMGLTLGPLLVMTGFMVEIAAILYNPNK